MCNYRIADELGAVAEIEVESGRSVCNDSDRIKRGILGELRRIEIQRDRVVERHALGQQLRRVPERINDIGLASVTGVQLISGHQLRRIRIDSDFRACGGIFVYMDRVGGKFRIVGKSQRNAVDIGIGVVVVPSQIRTGSVALIDEFGVIQNERRLHRNRLCRHRKH